MYLFINNLSDEHKTFLALIAGKTCKVITHADLAKKDKRSENILHGMKKFLNKADKNINDLKGVIVVNGPGTFTGIRVALSVANTIAWAKNIPVVGVKLSPSVTPLNNRGNEVLIKKGLQQLKKAKKNDMAVPFYGKEPHITYPQQRH